MKHAYVFPGQGSQFPGMGKNHYDKSAFAKKLFERGNEIAGFRLSDIMFTGSETDLRQTNVTQPAIFLHSVIAFKTVDNTRPEMVAGHSLGEFSALVANSVLSFEDGMRLVIIRSSAMQKACVSNPGTMAAVLAMDDERVEAICRELEADTGEVLVPANYNCPGQIVISGSLKGIELGCEKMKAAGARRAVVLSVGGAFHSPLMEPAREELKSAIEKTTFYNPSCPVYQNIVARAVMDKEEIKKNLIDQLTGPVRWTQSISSMIADGATNFTEIGPGKVLQGLIGKIDKSVSAIGVE
jgi:[acyl-carrier-protein] S-malonyltransferase